MALDHFHSTVGRWFLERIGTPSPPQVRGWPLIRSGHHTLISAPTGSGKTLAAFLWAIDGLLRRGAALEDRTEVLYVSPLKALGNDVRKNLERPLAELRAMDATLPEVRVLVRTGDTPQAERAAMRRRPPHILVTTPESLFILLTSESGRAMLGSVHTVILDEIHAVAGDKRGAHLMLSIERLESLARDARSTGAAGGLARGQDAVQRIGLSATQKPIADVAHFLVGPERTCETVDIGHRRDLDLAIEPPESPLETVCSTETWQEIVDRMAELIRAHRTTLVFVNTRKLAERIAAKLTLALGEGQVTSHHGSLSRDRRLEAEQRLKAGELKALVATASLELGIDIGEVDLVIQAGVTPSFAIFLQRVGRSGHALGRTPKGRLFPLTQDELVCAAALVDGIHRGELDRTPQPGQPLDILAQHVVSACVPETWDEERLFATFRQAWPYRALAREDFDSVIALHTSGRAALLHRDGVNGRLRATRRARITALTSGGAIPDTGQYRVVVEPEAIPVGTLDEDFAIESNVGDIFQLGNASWRILKVEPGVVRVADARGAPPTVPFWFGEAPARTAELSAGLARVRVEGRDPEWSMREIGFSRSAAMQLADYLNEGERTLGAIPTTECVVLERFFDESGGMQLVIHAPFGGRVNRAWGLALRKRFCRGFGFELQAAANEEAIVLSLGLQHSFPLEEVFDYLHPDRARDLLVQALLAAPMFGARWRWNLTRSLLLPRTQNGGKRVPTPLIRMRAEDALAQAFPQVLACPETLPPGEMPVPWEHPLVRQTIEDCLTEAMDVDEFLEMLRKLRDGRIRKVAVDTTEPSAFARGILNVAPYAFLDDAPLEERRTQAVISRRSLDPSTVDTLGALDPDAVARVRDEAWPQPESAEEVHESLLWMGYVTADEAERSGWMEWLGELRAARRVVLEGGAGDDSPRWRAVEANTDPVAVIRGRLEAIGPVFVAGPGERVDGSDAAHNGAPRSGADAPGGAHAMAADAKPFVPLTWVPASAAEHLAHLEAQGVVLRCRLEGRQAWCERRLLARIHRHTLERLRREIEPISAAELWRFLACWQHVAEGYRLEGPRGLMEVVRKLAGFEIPAAAWESSVLPARVRGYRMEWLDQLALSGEIVWGRLWGAGGSAIRSTPVCLLPREDLDAWLAIAAANDAPKAAAEPGRSRLGGAEPARHAREDGGGDLEPPNTALSTYARALLDLIDTRGASFAQELQRAAKLLPSHFEMGLAELIGHGLVTCDSFGGVRRMITSPSKRRGVMRHQPLTPAGRWSRFRQPPPPAPADLVGHAVARALGVEIGEAEVEFVARQLLNRYGVVFRRLLERERIPVPWRDLVRVYRHWELTGDVRGGRFVQRFAGEQYALPEAIDLMRRLRRKSAGERRDPEAPRLELHRERAFLDELHVSAADPLNLEGILTPEPRISSQARKRVLVGS
jgi:ATP-dependent helicase Lhr and Lhr-like helicase